MPANTNLLRFVSRIVHPNQIIITSKTHTVQCIISPDIRSSLGVRFVSTRMHTPNHKHSLRQYWVLKIRLNQPTLPVNPLIGLTTQSSVAISSNTEFPQTSMICIKCSFFFLQFKAAKHN